MPQKFSETLNKLRTNAHDNLDCVDVEPLKILVIRFKFIGDVMLTSVLANTLKQTFPKARVDYLIHDTSESLFSGHPYIDNVISLTPRQRKNPFHYLHKLKSIRAQRYDLIVDAQSTQKSELISMLAPRAAICIGRKKKGRGFFYTHTVNATPAAGHKIDERLKLLEPLGELGINVQYAYDMAIAVPPALVESYRQRMLDAGIDFSRPVFVFSVTAKLEYKKWRTTHIAEVAEHCLRCFNAQIVLYYGSAHEQADVEDFHADMKSNPNVHTNLHTDDLMALAALIRNCQLFIGNEGGPRHIAQALGVPSVAVFSPSAKKAEWLPSNSRAHQGVEWDDLVDKTKNEKASIHKNLSTGSDEYFRLYNKITAQPVIELVDNVAEFVGIKRVS